ncbi:MAG: hypothetical protein H6Q60_638 [Oscillospiraceae bacterium]|nr:hypothetical protein [Oscillospiraceae bacterium]
MNESKNGNLMYDAVPSVAALNRVPGFDPRKFLRKVVSETTKEEILKLDLKYKKLWFRLAYPAGRIRMSALRITDQLAIIEARVYFDKSDSKPVASFTSSRSVKDTPGGLYVQAAQYEAQDVALTDAGFGLQFCDVSHSPGEERFGTEIPVQAVSDTVQKEPLTQVSAPVEQSDALTSSETPASKQEKMSETPLTPTPVQAVSEPTQSCAVETANLQPEREPAEEPPAAEPVEATAPFGEEAAAPASSAYLSDEMTEERSSAEEPHRAIVTDFPVEAVQTEPSAAEIEEPAMEQAATPRYTPDMPMEEILSLMTLEEAQSLIVDVGTCNGWTMAQVADRRAASLKWYVFGYKGDNNILRAAAQMMLDFTTEQKAS